MEIKDLSPEAKSLLFWHICVTEMMLIGHMSKDTNIPYVKFRERTLAELSVNTADVDYSTSKHGGKNALYNTEICIKAIQSALKGNTQRATVRNLLWKFIDELEFDFHINSDWAYNYKWNLVNRIIKDKFWG